MQARVAPQELGLDRRTVLRTGAFVALHVVLGIAMQRWTVLGTAHALLCVAVGLGVAMFGRRAYAVAPIVGYIVGSEVLWRMTKVPVFWEFGKFASIAILFVATLRIAVRRNRFLPTMYFALLLPSAVLTFMTFDLSLARQSLSFSLSGPLLLAIAVIYFSNVRLGSRQVLATFVALLAPIVAVAAIAYTSTIRVDNIEFINASNFATSGGFGPNQVSAALGLGTMLLVLMTFDRRISWALRVAMLVLAGVLAAQSALTFSRGGLVLAFAGCTVATLAMLGGSARGRLTVLLVAFLSFGLAYYVIEPRLDELTRGKLSARYANTQSSGRSEFIESEMMMFGENPVLGVGPGAGIQYRVDHGLYQGASHTEYSRMLGEHGMLGILSLTCLAFLGLRGLRGPADPLSRAFAMAMLVWVALFLAINGTRVAAPSFMFGLVFAMAAPPRPKPAVPSHA